MLTRGQVAKRLGKSVATVRRMEGTRLHPTISERGVRYFEEDEVDAVAAQIQECGRALPQGAADGIANDDDRPTEEELDDLRHQLETAEMHAQSLKASLTRETERAEQAEVKLDEVNQGNKKWLDDLEECFGLMLEKMPEIDSATMLIAEHIDVCIEKLSKHR